MKRDMGQLSMTLNDPKPTEPNKTTQKCRQTAFNIEHSLTLSGELPMAPCEKHQHYLTQTN